MTCKHRNYNAIVLVANIEDTGARMAEININCADCDKAFDFVGLSVGCNFYQPTTDLSAQKLNAPIVPEGEKQIAGLPGFSMKMLGVE